MHGSPDKAHATGRLVMVCHVLRYTAFYSRLKELIDQGVVGAIQTLDAVENVGYYHQAHSFVRGNWRSSEVQTSPMILAEELPRHGHHPLSDGRTLRARVLLRPPRALYRGQRASGSAGRRPGLRGAPKAQCPYDAEKIYLTNPLTGLLHGNSGWPVSVLVHEPTEESVRKALCEGPYGRCVYRCDNDVVDHQVVSHGFCQDGATATFTMAAFTKRTAREIKVMGTAGELGGGYEHQLGNCLSLSPVRIRCTIFPSWRRISPATVAAITA